MNSADTMKEQVRKNKGWWMSIRVEPMDGDEMQKGGGTALIEVR